MYMLLYASYTCVLFLFISYVLLVMPAVIPETVFDITVTLNVQQLPQTRRKRTTDDVTALTHFGGFVELDQVLLVTPNVSGEVRLKVYAMRDTHDLRRRVRSSMRDLDSVLALLD